MMLSTQDHARVAEAVKAAEAKTTGEIFCIVAHEVSQYRETPLAWGAGAALILPPIALLMGLHPALTSLQGETWGVGAAPSLETTLAEAIGLYAAAQAVLFTLVAFIVSLPPLRRALTPAFLKAHRVQRMAQAHFASTGLIHAEERTGVLIFASLKDRQVQIVADKAIHDAVGDPVWDAAVEALIAGMKRRQPGEGFVRAIGLCGDALAAHFPSNGPHDNRFSDELVEI